jgi:hypothetical protein
LSRPDFHSNIRRLLDNTSLHPHLSEASETPVSQGFLQYGMDSALHSVPAVARHANIELGCPAPDARLEPRVSRLFVPIRNLPGRRPEDVVLILLIYLLPFLRKALDRAEHSRRDAYLASAVDMGELERRMHSMEIDR